MMEYSEATVINTIVCTMIGGKKKLFKVQCQVSYKSMYSMIPSVSIMITMLQLNR